ncbi:jupiter microtubule associated homolog 1-like isoform X5 [Macrobrachium rosenbergii]|uniref:jupiter microtubule associated homolog 1-like isoform X5 n=1 Tax=Macrobrachium rosenbergii TaxID=79674 RepID=UPI0034D433C3
MTTTNTFVGISDSHRISSRVLKPPGGGSSISFGEEDNLSHRGNSTPVEEAPKNDNQEQQSPKAETNGTSSPPQTPKENGTNSVTENSPSTATNTATTNGVALNGTVTNGTTSGSSTPNSSRLDTQSRLFGEEPQKMSSRRVRDHHRSNIFSDSDENVPSKSANPIGNETPEPKTPEVKTPEQPQPQIQQQQRQRVPPGGFSSKLW